MRRNQNWCAMQHQIADLKARFTIADVWAALGLPSEAPKTSRSICSPFRPDKHPSFSVYDVGRKYHDYATGKGGDVFDFIAEALCISNADALRWLLNFAGIPRPERPVTKSTSADEAERRKIAIKEEDWRKFWGSIRRPVMLEMESIASLRRVSVKAVLYLVEDGLLVIGRWQHHDVWAIRSGTFAQARPMGRTHFWEGGPKTINMSADTPAFVFARNNSPTGTRVLLAEGFVELLALVELEIRADDYRREHFPDTPYRPVAFAVAASAGSRLTGSALGILGGRTVRFLPDNDPPGHEATQHWTDAMEATGAAVDNRLMPTGKDPTEALPTMPAAYAYDLLQF